MQRGAPLLDRLAQPIGELCDGTAHVAGIRRRFEGIVRQPFAGLHGAEQAIVKFSREASAFVQPLVETGVDGGRYAADTETIGDPSEKDGDQETEETEDFRLVP